MDENELIETTIFDNFTPFTTALKELENEQKESSENKQE